MGSAWYYPLKFFAVFILGNSLKKMLPNYYKILTRKFTIWQFYLVVVFSRQNFDRPCLFVDEFHFQSLPADLISWRCSRTARTRAFKAAGKRSVSLGLSSLSDRPGTHLFKASKQKVPHTHTQGLYHPIVKGGCSLWGKKAKPLESQGLQGAAHLNLKGPESKGETGLSLPRRVMTASSGCTYWPTWSTAHRAVQETPPSFLSTSAQQQNKGEYLLCLLLYHPVWESESPVTPTRGEESKQTVQRQGELRRPSSW